jgi:hypothetical protein
VETAEAFGCLSGSQTLESSAVQLDLFRPLDRAWLTVGARQVPMRVVHNPRARRYLLRVNADGSARLTVPRRGSVAEGYRFAERHLDWVGRQLLRLAAQPQGRRQWRIGSTVLLRGEAVRLEAGPAEKPRQVRLGAEVIDGLDPAGDLRPALDRHLRALAGRELPARVLELAVRHQFSVSRVTIRNQRTRWGSCSRRGAISLNWRLIQTPPAVRDYLILHELAHLRHLNHSGRFWAEVERICPAFREAERWLKKHDWLLR